MNNTVLSKIFQSLIMTIVLFFVSFILFKAIDWLLSNEQINGYIMLGGAIFALTWFSFFVSLKNKK